MKNSNFTTALFSSAMMLCTSMSAQPTFAQTWERVYADNQTNNSGLFSSVTDATAAIDADLNSASNINVTVLGSTWQQFTFPESPGTNPIHVKIGKKSGLLSALGTIKITAYNAGGDPVGSQTASALLGLLDGLSQSDIVVYPTAAATSIRVTYSAISIGGGVDIYEAYFDKPTTSETYNLAADVIWGASGSLLTTGLLSPVSDAGAAIDGDESTAATILSLASAANTNSITAIYNSLSAPGDSVRIVLNDSGGLLDLDLLASGLTVSTFNNNEEENIFNDASLLSIELLPGMSEKYALTIHTTVPFNRIEVGTSGVLAALHTLEVYEIGRKIPAVAFPSDTIIYAGGDLPTLLANLPNATDQVVWFNTPTPTGSPLFTGTSVTLPEAPISSGYYYAYIQRNGVIHPESMNRVYVQVKTIAVRPIAILEGAYRSATGAMTAKLAEKNYIPTAYLGMEQENINTLTVDGARAVDWVRIELRDTTPSRQLIATKPGILLTNGQIVAPSTLDSLSFIAAEGTYFLIIKHRNHLGVATKTYLHEHASVVDFTTPTTITSTQKTLDDKLALHCGDMNYDGEVNVIDYSLMRNLTLEGGYDAYLQGDVDFNTEVNVIDLSKVRVKTLLSPFISYSSL
jgi:hypothetical protein